VRGSMKMVLKRSLKTTREVAKGTKARRAIET
jgi:hypothetical protein